MSNPTCMTVPEDLRLKLFLVWIFQFGKMIHLRACLYVFVFPIIALAVVVLNVGFDCYVCHCTYRFDFNLLQSI